MNNTRSISHNTSGVNMTATLSLLSEGEVFCNRCGRRIDGKAVHVTKKRPHYHKSHELEIVALLHPSCYGWKDDE